MCCNICLVHKSYVYVSCSKVGLPLPIIFQWHVTCHFGNAILSRTRNDRDTDTIRQRSCLFIFGQSTDLVLLAVPGLIWRTRKRTTLQTTQTLYQRRGSRGTIWEASASLTMLLVTVAWNVFKLKCVFFVIGIAVRCWKQFSSLSCGFEDVSLCFFNHELAGLVTEHQKEPAAFRFPCQAAAVDWLSEV